MYELPDVRKSAEELIARAAQHVCDDLIEQPVSSLGEIELPDELDLREPAVHDLQIAPETLVVYTDELISDDTAVGNASADASLTVQGLLPKAKAVAAARDGLVRIIDHNYSHRRSLVAFTTKQQLEVEFEVIFVLDSESVNSVVFSGATQLIPHSAEHGFRCG
ncbi:MAG TPA: hypothetical protein VMU51_05850 [Mycobacteriales bacterium]|nr:hypothetical protein [Mycobacteriales bacterium]